MSFLQSRCFEKQDCVASRNPTSRIKIRGLTLAVASQVCFLISLLQFLIYKMGMIIALHC